MSSSSVASDPSLAVSVGLCAHGLSVARALDEARIPVLALEANSELPGFHSSRIEVAHIREVNGPGLVDGLIDLAAQRNWASKPVLFLTNDNMVRIVGEAWPRLDGLYRMSWSGCRDRLLPLLDKAALESHCDALALPYPRSRLLSAAADLDRLAAEGLAFPLIVKPTRPLSGFKVRLIENIDALRDLLANYARALPFLLQQWIPGGDQQLFFTAFYLDEGRILATYEGQKLGSNPPAMGQTTIARSAPNAAARAIAERFFAPLKLSGPVSLEVKLDPDGQPWIIEPTLGRTDYWLDCCVANGVNLPAIEFAHQTGTPVTTPRQRADMIWFDTERAPLSYVRFRFGAARDIDGRWTPRFPYWGHHDTAPFYRSVSRVFGNYAKRAWRKLARYGGVKG